MKMTIRKKLLGSFVVVLLLLIITGGYSNYHLDQVNKSYQELFEDRVYKLVTVKDLKQEMTNQTLAVRGYVISNDEGQLDSYEKSIKVFEQKLEELKGISNHTNTVQLIETLDVTHNKYQDIVHQALAYKKAGNNQGYVQLMNGSAKEAGATFNQAIEDLLQFQVGQMEKGIKDANNSVEQTSQTSLMILITALVLGIGLALWISRQISLPVQAVVHSMKEVAAGNLVVKPVKVRTRDEIRELAEAFNQMSGDLRTVVSDVRESSTSVAASSEQLNASAQESSSASEEIAQLVQQSAEGTEQQLRLFTEVQESMNEMASGMHSITRNSEDMLKSTESANVMTKEGNQSVTNVVNQMVKIHESVESTSKVILSLGNRSKEIQEITGFITQIAEQTNLLALNAAIEAARAGEHGKGFAVVADEVRKLAEESRKSAEQITDMIAGIQEETEHAVESMVEQNRVVEEGLQYTKETSTSFSHIEQSIEVVSNRVEEVSSSIEELHALSDQIVQAIEQVKEIAEASAAAAQEVSAGTEENVATIEEVSALSLIHI